jgi:DNA-binding XRE family transcriptional regulator
MPAGFVAMMARDRARLGLTVGQAAWRLGITRQEYCEIEAGTRWPSSIVWERMRELYGWL